MAKKAKKRSKKKRARNPKRPPKRFMKKCVKAVKRRGGARNARAVCATTYRKMSPKKRRAAARGEPRRKKKNRARPVSRRWYERYLASPAGRLYARDPPALANRAYWKQPITKRKADVAKLYRGSGRQRRAAIAIARAEQRHAEGPPRRRTNPGLSDAQARAAYDVTHWGRRGRGGVARAGAANPSHGTAVKLGRLVQVTYETRKGRERAPAHYVHDFEGNRPVLAFNDGGLLVLGGDYEVTEHGIEG